MFKEIVPDLNLYIIKMKFSKFDQLWINILKEI